MSTDVKTPPTAAAAAPATPAAPAIPDAKERAAFLADCAHTAFTPESHKNRTIEIDLKELTAGMKADHVAICADAVGHNIILKGAEREVVLRSSSGVFYPQTYDNGQALDAKHVCDPGTLPKEAAKLANDLRMQQDALNVALVANATAGLLPVVMLARKKGASAMHEALTNCKNDEVAALLKSAGAVAIPPPKPVAFPGLAF